MSRAREEARRHHERGRRGEAAAARYLMRRGWRLLARNWTGAGGELDIVAIRRGVLVAVEVKVRDRAAAATGEVLGSRQLTRVARGLIDFRRRHPSLRAPELRVDLVIVDLDRWPARIRHVVDIATDDIVTGGRDSPLDRDAPEGVPAGTMWR